VANAWNHLRWKKANNLAGNVFPRSRQCEAAIFRRQDHLGTRRCLGNFMDKRNHCKDFSESSDCKQARGSSRLLRLVYAVPPLPATAILLVTSPYVARKKSSSSTIYLEVSQPRCIWKSISTRGWRLRPTPWCDQTKLLRRQLPQ
jgi:hypothetical protein